MRTAEQWLSAYAQTHQNPFNKKVHVVCVPAIMFSMIGLLWLLRWPGHPELWWLNGATVAALPVLLFYARISLKILPAMTALLAANFLAVAAVEAVDLPLLWICVGVFIVAWIAQFWGHHVEGKKPSFFEDLQFLLIGPLWLVFG